MKALLPAIALTLSLAAPAVAQHMHHEHQNHHPGQGGAGFTPGYGSYGAPMSYGGYGGYGNAVGLNPWVAMGEYRLLASMACINQQIACSRAIENNLRATQVYYAKRDLHDSWQANTTVPRATAEELKAQSAAAAPHRLTSSQYDATSGTIYWPAVLLQPEFSADLTELEALFEGHSLARSGLGSRDSRQIAQLTRKLEANLKATIGQQSPAEYIAGKKFLTSLRYESQFARPVHGLASR